MLQYITNSQSCASVHNQQQIISFDTSAQLYCTYLNLALHRHAEEREEIHNENGPEDGNVERIETCAEQGDIHSFCRAVPVHK